MKQNREPIQWILPVCTLAACISAAFFLMGAADALCFLRWYVGILALGIGFYPLTSIVFRRFTDKGWLFSKTIGLLISGYVVWAMSCSGILAFTNRRALVVTIIAAGFCWTFFLGRSADEKPSFSFILSEEAAFAVIFFILTFIAGFRPEAQTTEKFMDYGFLASMLRSVELPPLDIWYGTERINYYYGGQYYAAYLARITWVPASRAYTLMRMMVGAFAFMLPFSLVHQMLREFLESVDNAHPGKASVVRKHKKGLADLGAVLAGTAVAFAGNVHYVLYGLFGKVFKLSGYEDYWFPSSTRYIGHNPLTDDQCIHEYPSYSIVLGDLHAHMVNIIFVLTVIAVIYTWLMEIRTRYADRASRQQLLLEEQLHRPKKYEKTPVLLRLFRFIGENVKEPRLYLAAFIIGVFRFTNYWDYVIYLTVALICIVFDALYTRWGKPVVAIGGVLIHAVLLTGIGVAASMPFMMTFTTMVSGVALAENHSALYQLLILWGLPIAVLAVLAPTVIAVCGRRKRAQKDLLFFHGAELQDFFALILGFCGLGLVLIPELVYVRDIYEDGFARSNTMFKLTYQAWIMFAVMMGYAFVRLFADLPERISTQAMDGKVQIRSGGVIRRVLTGALAAVFLLTCFYFPYAVSCWYGNVFDLNAWQGLDATAYLDTAYPEDASAIRWLNQEVEFQPLILEAPGDSYSEYNVVSAMTGLPTLEGWYVHEWLWRNDPEDLNRKRNEIDFIYTSDDVDAVRRLLYKYDISYIYVGSCERALYPELNDRTLQKLGDVVFEDGSTYIVAVGRQ